MKRTIWVAIPLAECKVIEALPERDQIRVKHPKLARARWFSRSRGGNWYSRYTLREADASAEGYILVLE